MRHAGRIYPSGVHDPREHIPRLLHPSLHGAPGLHRRIHTDEPAAATAPVPSTAPATLSPRELEVLRLIADGHSNPQIAAQLVIAPGTVGRHVSNLLAKTGLSNRVDLTRYAIEHGLLDG